MKFVLETLKENHITDHLFTDCINLNNIANKFTVKKIDNLVVKKLGYKNIRNEKIRVETFKEN